MHRRDRTRRLIELGGLVDKSGLVALLGDDDPDAVLLGALLALAAELQSGDEPAREAAHGSTSAAPSAASRLALWRRRGQRAFRVEPGDAADGPREQGIP